VNRGEDHAPTGTGCLGSQASREDNKQ